VGLLTKNILTVDSSPVHIINGCIANNKQSQEQMYSMMYAVMMKVCMRYTGNLDDAAVLYNEAMLKVFNKIKQYEFKGSFEGWVKRIVIHTCVDDCRKNARYNKQQWLDDTKALHIAIQPEVYSQLEANDIMQLVMQLPKNTASVFNLFVIDGYKHNEIATLLNISEGTSKWHLNEARRLLKIKLETIGLTVNNKKINSV
jgi:RNA polymerase sigma-70 factor (ECF subfamily)